MSDLEKPIVEKEPQLESGEPQSTRDVVENDIDLVAPASEFTSRSIMALIGAFCIMFVSVGYVNAFGVFQEYYTEHLLSSSSPSSISWLGSVNVFTLYFMSLPSGILFDNYGPRPLIILGTVVTIFAVFMTSLCKVYYQFFLAQGVLLGLGIAFLFCPAVASITLYFRRSRGLALGIVVSGSSLGGVVWPIVLRNLLQNVSFGWTVRVAGFMMLFFCGIACLTVRSPLTPTIADVATSLKPAKPDRKLDLSVAKDPTLILLSLSLFFTFLGLFAPFFYIAPYAISFSVSPGLSFYMISILNAASLFGRLIPGYLADRHGAYNLCILATASSAVIVLCWINATTTAGIAIWGAAYGFSSGAIISLLGACAARTTKPEQYGTVIGLVMVVLSIAALIGPPINGQLLSKSGYLALSMFSGCTLLIGALGMAAARWRIDRRFRAVV